MRSPNHAENLHRLMSATLVAIERDGYKLREILESVEYQLLIHETMGMDNYYLKTDLSEVKAFISMLHKMVESLEKAREEVRKDLDNRYQAYKLHYEQPNVPCQTGTAQEAKCTGG